MYMYTIIYIYIYVYIYIHLYLYKYGRPASPRRGPRKQPGGAPWAAAPRTSRLTLLNHNDSATSNSNINTTHGNTTT